MKLSERHIIRKNHIFYKECDDLCFKSKNIYNLSLYKIKKGLELNDFEPLNRLYHHMKNENCYKELPAKVSTATIIQVQKNYKAYFKSLESYNKDNSKFISKPKQPRFLNKEKGRFIISYNYQAILKSDYKKEHKIGLSGTNIKFYTKIDNFESIDCVRIVPKSDYYVIEVCYEIPDVKPVRDVHRYAAIDLGVNNLATITSNTKELKPIIINGRPLKSINQFYNKKLAIYKSQLEKINKKKTSKRIKKLTNKRNRKVEDYLHKSSKLIVDILKNNNISKLVIGKNDNWKQEVDLKSKNNQNFVSIPHNSFIDKLVYKCEKSGIRVILQEESFTSKASFLDLDNIPTYGVKEPDESYGFGGYREHRGIYKLKGKKIRINADVNGSYNILRKAIPNAFPEGIEDVVVHPLVYELRTKLNENFINFRKI